MQKIKKKVLNTVLMFALLFFCSSQLYAQQKRTITGTVTESNGDPVIGASVMVKGTSVGTSTNLDGQFTLSISEGNILVVSYLGFSTKEVPISGNVVNVVLEENATMLDELVVIGYGTARKKDLTGSVSTISGADIAKVPVTSTAQALTGRLPGVQITTSDGSPDAEMIIRVRGGGSITGDNSPLYIVDGFPVSSISDIAPTDIADITILKDAASTAIYGSRGANGVVLITTKNAEGGKTKISYNGYLQGKSISKTIDVMDPYDFVMFNYEKAALRRTIPNFEKRYGAFEDLDLYKYQEAMDWQDDMFGNADLSQSHNLSITGGTDKTKFSLSGTYVTDNSLMKDNGYERFNLNFKLNHELAKGLRLEFGTRMSDTETKGIGTSGGKYKIRSYETLTKAPVNGMYDFVEVNTNDMDETELEEYLSDIMTLQEKTDQYWRRKNERRYNFTGAVAWDITKDFTYRLEGGYDYLFREQKDWYGRWSSNAIQDGGKLPMGEWEKKNSWSYRIANTLTWNQVINEKHSFNVLVGQEINVSGAETLDITAKYFQKDITPEKMFASLASNSGESGSRTISSSLSQEDKMASFFGRINYSYDDRYLFAFTMRADGSSKFIKGNRWGYFPAASAGWRIAEESFMESTRDWLSNLKLRASYGEAGNNRIGNSMYETLYKAYSSSKYYGAGGIFNPHYTLNNSQMANPNLKWETTITRGAGVDFGFWNERLSGSFDYYWNTTKDLLVERQIVAPGYSTVQENIGQTSNRGVEVALTGHIIQKKDFTLSMDFNISFNKNKVDKLSDVREMSYMSEAFSSDTKERDDYRVIVGEPLGLIYGFVYDGIYQVDDFVTYTDANGKTQFQFDNSGNYILKEGIASNGYLSGSNGGIRPGAMKLKDFDDNGIIDANDRKIIGRSTPKHIGGFGINATFKGFDVSALFNWVYGNDIYNMDKIVSTQSYRMTYSNLRDYMNPATSAWTYLDRSNGQIITDYETLKAMNAGKTYWSPLTMPDNNPIVTSWAVEDGSYLRFQNLTVGYTLPQTFTRKFACNQLRLYCTLNNIYTWTDYTGYDPEVNSSVRNSSTSGVTPGIDFSAYPKSFSWTVGANITF